MAVQITLELENIKGESKIVADAIDVYSWSWGASQAGTWHTGGGGGGGQVSIQDLTCVKYVDRSTTDLIKHCCMGTHIASGTLKITKAGGTPLDYFVIELKKIIVATYTTGGAPGEEEVTETLGLNFAEFKTIYKQQDDQGGVADESDISWSVEQNKEV